MFLFWNDKSPKNDEKLLFARAQKGDTDRLGILLEMHRDALRRFLFSLSRFRDLGEDSIDDAIQEAFYQIARDITRIRLRSGQFRTYLFAVARMRCLDIVRKRNAHPEQSVDDENCNEIADSNQNAADLVNSKTDLSRAMAQLIDYERYILKLYYNEELKLEVISKLIGKSAAQVSRDLHKAREKLQKLLES